MRPMPRSARAGKAACARSSVRYQTTSDAAPDRRPPGATTATAIFGGLTPLAAQYATTTSGWPSTPGLMIALVALAVLPLLWRMNETAPLQLNRV